MGITMSRESHDSRIQRLGIEGIAAYIPEKRISNYARLDQFEITEAFINGKIGVKSIALKDDEDDTSDLCVKAYKRLISKVRLNIDDIDVAVVITQNPDTNIPHTSAIVHGKLGLPESCACFDISLGCSGFVYGLNIIQSLMQANNFRKGLLFTADPYSKIVDRNDKNTSLLFGDAATVTLISGEPLYTLDDAAFGTIGKDFKSLISLGNKLYMNGRAIYNFTVTNIPKNIKAFLKKSDTTEAAIDKFIFHQGSKHIVDSLTKELKLDKHKVVFDISEYGNTVSSSIPIILEKELLNSSNKQLLICGFGAGLSWSIGMLRKNMKL